jgi:hypothetical protein
MNFDRLKIRITKFRPSATAGDGELFHLYG